jgi:hypothetical protein
MRSVEERFLSHVDKRGPIPAHRPDLGACHLWTGSVDEKGYGCFGDGKRSRKAHAFAYEAAKGPIPEGKELDHLCRNRPCVNHAYLEAVTHRENCQRAQYLQETCSRNHPLPDPGPDGRRICRECANERNRAYKKRQRASRTPKESRPFTHGRGAYTHHGCRCEVCCDAENSYKRQWRRDQKVRIYDAVMRGAL